MVQSDLTGSAKIDVDRIKPTRVISMNLQLNLIIIRDTILIIRATVSNYK